MDEAHPISEQIARAHPKGRIVWVDVARGVALVAMAIYHFAWDLQHFGYITPPTVDVGGWKAFARADASSFLFLVGVSLVLANGPAIRWRGFWKRFATIVAGAAAITLVTYVVTPADFIFFGILQCIAAASLIGLFFLRVPAAVTLLVAAAVLAAPFFLAGPAFDHPALWFVGLSTKLRPSSDYVPLLPWLAPVLAGIALARIARRRALFDWLRARDPDNRVTGALAFGGRHSLAVYLLHQPVLFGLVFLASQVAPAPRPDPVPVYMSSCTAHCSASRDAKFCERFCGCTVDGLKARGLFDGVFSGKIDVSKTPAIQDLAEQCTRKSESAEPPG